MPFIPSAGSSGSGTTLTSAVINQTAHGFIVGDVIRHNGTIYVKAQADNSVNAEAIGIVQSIPSANDFTFSQSGLVSGLSGLTAGGVYYLSDSTAGSLTATEPADVSEVSKPILIAASATTGYFNNWRGSPAQGQTAVVQHGSVVLAATQTQNSNTPADISTLVYTLPVAGTYVLQYSLSTDQSTTDAGYVFIANSTNVEVAGSRRGRPGVTTQHILSASVIVSVTAPSTYKLRYVNNGDGDFLILATGTSYSGISWTQIGAAPVPMSLVGEYGELVLSETSISGAGSSSFSDFASNQQFTIPTAGTWDVSYNIYGNPSDPPDSFSVRVVDVTGGNVAVINSVGHGFSSSTPGPLLASNVFRVTTTGANTYKIQAKQSNTSNALSITSNNTTATSKVTYSKISGFIPSSGQTVDYVNVSLSSTAATTVGNAVLFDGNHGGNIPYNTSTGLFSLTAGKTYKLSFLGSYNTTNASLQWQTSAGVALNSSLSRASGSTAPATTGYNVIYTPSVNTDVKLSVTVGTYTPSTANAQSAVITQVGTSAVIAGPYPGTWASYTPVVTSTTGTNPTMPTSATITGSYSIQGKTMFLNLKYYAATTTGGADGSQSYAYSIPAGYTIDLTKAAVPSVLTNTSGSGLDGGCVGSGFGRNASVGNASGLIVMPLSSTTIGAYFEGQSRLIGAGSLAMTGQAATAISMTCQIPLV